MKLVISLFFAACFAAATCQYFQLQEGFEYLYREDVECHLGKSGTILVKAKVSFTPIKTIGRQLEISQAVYHVIFQDKVTGRQSQADSEMDFSKWFSIVISLDHGDIEKVFHPPDEDSTILGMKKSFATILFGKLHSHDDPTLTDIQHDRETGKWSYSTMENGHEGLHNASYTAEPNDQGIRFTKTRLEHPQLKTAVNNYTKVLHYDSHLGLVSKVNVDEFIEVGKAPKGFDPFENDRQPLPNDTYIRAETPTMTATSVGSAQLLARNRLRGPSIMKPKSGLVDGMIHVKLETYGKIEPKVKDPNYAKYLRGNFTCLQKLSDYGSLEGIKCFKGLVNVLKNLPDEDLITVTDQVFKGGRPLLEKLVPGATTSADSLHLVDALFDIGTDLSIGLLVEFAFKSNTEILKRTFFILSDVDKPSFEVFDTALERYCFFPETFPDSVQDDETHHQALLALGSLVRRHDLNGRKEEAHRLVGKLEAVLGLHDPHAYNMARSTLNEEDAGSFDLKHVVLLESLGNAVMDRSYDHIISYVNSSSHSVLKRAGLHALRQFQRDSAVSALYHAATKDESMLIRHESTIILRRHKRKAMFPMVNPPGSKIGPMTSEAARHHRERRDIKLFNFELKSPSIDWRKMLGSKSIGASFGLIIKNQMNIKIEKLKAEGDIDVHDEAYAKLHLGIVGYTYNFLVARVCFNGMASYNLNILQEFNFQSLLKQIKDYFNLVGDTVDAIKDGIKFIQGLVNGDVKIKNIIEDFVKSLEDMPKKIADIGRKGFQAMRMIGMFDDTELPAFLRPAKNVIIRITNLYNSIKTSIMDFYNKMTDAVITFRRSFKTIFESVKAIIDSVKNFKDSPKQALAAVFKGVINIKLAVTDFLEAKNATMNACFFLKDEKPDWWDLKTIYTEIKEDVKVAFKAIVKGGKKWVIDIATSDDPIAKLTNGKTTMKKVKEKFLADLQAVINVIVDPFKTFLGNIAQPFIEAYQRVTDIIQKLKDAYVKLKKGYDTARQIIAVLFGPKAHARFPRTTRLAGSGKCRKSGFWPSNIGYRSGEGIDLTIRVGAQVVAPFAGKISLTNNREEVKILITDGSLSNTYVYITNVNPNDTIQKEGGSSYSERQVYAGQVIGVATNVPCTTVQNHIHLVMKKTSGKVIDPTNFLAKRLIEPPKWEINCNDYKYIFKDEVKASGWGSPGSKSVNSLPPGPSKPGTSMKPKAENEPAGGGSELWSKIKEAAKAKIGKRRKRGLFSGKNSLLSKLGFPKLGQKIMTTLKKFNMKKLKLGKVVEFLKALGMKESTKQLAQVIKRIKELIDAKPCFNPHQLTDDQLRNELADRRLATTGSRQLMVERILHSEPKCPLIQLKMPKQIHCVFDENCLAVQCCMNLKIMMFNKAIRAFVRLDPCDFKFEIGVDEWKYSVAAKDIYFNKEGTLASGIKFDMFDMDLEIVIGYKLEKTENVALISFNVGACSQDDHSSCFVDVPLLDEAVIPLPICRPDGSVQWPEVNWDEFFSLDAVKERLKEAGKKVIKEVAKAVVKEVLEKLGIPESLLSSSGPCPRPEVMNIKKLKNTLKAKDLAVTGSRADLNARLALADLNCEILKKKLTLPAITNPTLKKILYYKISPTCTRIDACAEFTVKALGFTKSFKAFVDIDVCKYMIKIGFETIIHPIPIFVFDWGKPQQQKITKNIIVSYTIGRDDTKKVFVVSLGIKMCLATNDCPIDVTVLTNKEIPQPLCNSNFSLDAFKPGDGSLGKFLKELGGQMNRAAFNYILKLFKLDKILSDDACTNTQPAPTCPWSLNLRLLPQSVRNKLTCRLSDNCFGAGCCLHLPFKLPFVTETIHKYLDVSFEFDPCEFTIETKFGPEVKKTKLGYYNWGEVSTISVGHGDPAPIVMTYSMKKSGTNVILNMKISICLQIEGQSICIPDENGIEVFKDKSVPLCDANAMVALAKSFKVSTLKDYMKAQGMVLGKAIVGAGIDMFLEQTGIKEYLQEPGCDSANDPYTPAVNGWKNDCKLSLFKLPRLPDYVKCHFDESCTSVKCCLDVDFYGIYTRSFHFYITLDTCDLIFKAGLEKITYSYTLLKYHWGETEDFSILNMFNVKYSIQKISERKVFILNAELCVSFEKNGICDHKIKFMDNTEIPQLQCDLAKGIANLPSDINSLKKYMKKLGTQAAGLALMIPLRMLGLGSIIGVEGLCPDQQKPVKNPCPFIKDFKITLPTLSSSMNCAVQPECRGIECCISIDLGFMQRSFRTFVTIDPFSYQLTIGFEKWRFNRYLFTYEWGKEEIAPLGSAIKLIFSIAKSQMYFIINLRLESTISEYMPVYVTILRDYMFPIPIVNKNAVYKFPFPSWSDFKKNVQGVTGKTGDYVWDATKKFLGLDDVIDGGLCVPKSNIDAINKERCPHLTMPSLPSAVQCTFDDLCMGATCCVELDFKVVKKWLKAWLIVRPLSFSAGIERKSYDRSLDDGFWGERMTLKISKYFNMIFKVTKIDATKMLSIDLSMQMKLYDEIVELFALEDFKIPQSFYNADWKLGAPLDSFRFLRGSVTNAIMRRLDLNMDFFELKPCPLPSSEPANNACAFKMPKWLTNTIRVITKPNCLGIQACVRFKLLSIEYDFKVLMEIDPKDYKIRIAVEKLEWTKYIFENFGQENTFFIKNALGVTYKLETNENGLLVTTVGIRICIDGHCTPSIQLLDKALVPMPYIADDGTLVWPSADPAKMKDWLYSKALETTKDLLGVGDDFFKGKTCAVPTGATCPYFSLPTLPSFARCKLSKYCTGIECCIDVGMKIAKWSFKAWALLDPCKFVFSFGFEKWMFNDTLFSYKWGEPVEKNIASTINITYAIGKTADNRNFVLTVKFSVKLDKFSISIPPIVLLDKAKIPIPICNQDIKLPSRLIWQDPRKWKEQASAIALTRIGIDAKVLEPSGCKPLNNDNNKRCPHFTLPKTLPFGLSLHVMEMCTGIEACLNFDLKIIKRSFKAFILIDPCTLSFSLGFEKWTMKKTLSASLFGQEFVEKIGKLTLKYTIDKTADNRDFIFTLKAVLCLDGTCLPDVVIINKAMMPIPFCDKDGTFKWPSFDRINAGGEKLASALVMNRMGVDMDSLIGGECTPPASSSAVCPYVKIDKLPIGIKCELTEYCTGIKCCASLDLKIVKRNFKFWAILDPCEFSLSIGFENAHYNRSLTGYTFGTKQTLTIGHVKIHYTIDVSNDKKEFVVDLDLQLCLDSACLTKEILKKHSMPIPFCNGLPGSFSISWPSAQNYGSVLYNILGVGLDFFKPKPCIIKKSTTSCTGVSLPTFTQNHCQLKSNCLGIECCFEYDLHVSKVKMSFYFYFDQCKNELHFGLENKAYVVPLGVDVDGKQKVKAIGSMLSVKYRVYNTGYTFKASVELDWCWKNPFTKKKTCGNYEFLKEASFKQFDCPTRKRRSVENIGVESELDRMKRALDIGKLKDQVKGLKDKYDKNKDKIDTAKDIWSITKSLVKGGKTGKQIKEYFEQLKKKLPKIGLSTKNLKLKESQREELQAIAGQGVGSFVSGNRIVAGDLQVEGANAIKAMLGKVNSIAGRANELFTPGAGLTNAGVDLLGAQLASMTIGEIAAMIDMQNLDPVIVFKLLQDIRKLFEAIYDDLIDAFLSGNMKEFALGDLHLKQRFKIGPNYMEFFRYSIPFMIWIIPCEFVFGVQGYVGVEVEIGAKILQMWAYGIATPYTGVLVYGEVIVCARCPLEAKLRLDGSICELRFPTMADTYFNKFPLDVAVRMDLVLIPLQVRLSAIVTLRIKLVVKTVTITLFKAVLFRYQSPSIRKTLFDTHTVENDHSAAIMEDLSKPSGTTYNMTLHNDSGKRSITSARCVVNQLAMRDYTDPAVEISAKATDDESQVKLYLDIGFSPGTSEIYKGKELSGQSTILTEVFSSASGRKLHFRLCGSNSAGAKTCVDCAIPTYDVTLPVLRVTSNFLITSNKHVIEGSYRGFDDSAVATTDGELFGFGLGKGLLDDQVSPWKQFSSQAKRKEGRSGDNPATLHATGRDGEDWFTVPVVGRLTGVRVTKKNVQVHSANQCARHCLKFVPQKCMSFNYDYGSNGTCELLEGIESIDNKLTKDNKYVYFERFAIGSTVSFSRKDLNLKHNDLYYINVFIKNMLGYGKIAASRGILTDFTIPEPGPLGNYSKADDILEFMKCEQLIANHKEKWGKLCVGVDEKEKNHRRVIDGPGAKTMFNGLKPLEDLLYTRANRFVGGNWDGFYDRESGLRGYTFAVGKKFCEERIMSHHDPHDHLFDESEWTHLGVVMPKNPLADGTYYLTIRAFNKADYGGPLAMTVCHSVPYIIDNTPPIFGKLFKIEYNETSHWIKANHTARDPESGIQKMYGCLGRTTKGCEVLDWLLLSSMEYVSFIHKLPDGIPVWVRASAYNNVDMHTVGRADYPIMVDTSPPTAGTVYDGETIKADWEFTKYDKKICANWFGFKDTESGITAIELSVGTTPLGVDIVNRSLISSHEHSACIDLEPFKKVLVHKGKYCFTVTAWNGGVNRLHVNGSSDCVLVDLTKPETGDIIDGNLNEFRDVKISSLSTIVSGQFRNFKDAESGIIDEEIQVEVAPAAMKDQYKVAHSYESIFDPAGVTGFQWGHFHLRHKDQVRSTIQVTNGARNAAKLTTNGYLVDLTPPELDYIFDGKSPRKDISFQTSDTEMGVNYQFHDDESGIDHYRVLLFQVYQNTRKLIGESPHLPNDQNLYINSSLSIENGASVYAMVESENTAVPGLLAMFLTSGVKVDKSPPVVIGIYTGVNAGEDEEIYDDSVVQSDTKGILGSWKAKDTESGIQEYKVCVGTKVDKCDELYWRSMGTAEDGYIGGLNLSVTGSTGKHYYLRVVAINGAGLTSLPMTGTKMTILNGDITGHNIDGADGTDSEKQKTIGADIDYTLDDHTVTMQFEGFKSHEYGIQHIEWAIGMTPCGEEVQPFMAEGIVLSDGGDSLVGQVGSGKASAAVDLQPGKKYYTSARVTTYERKVLEACSDGIIVDHTAPKITITHLGLTDSKKDDLSEGNVIYQYTDAQLSAAWQYTEDTSGIAFAEVAVSSIPGEWDIHPLTNIGKIRADMITSIPDEKFNSTVKPRKGGVANMLEVYAGNDVGLISSLTSAIIVIDDTPPTCGTVTCPKYTKAGTTGLTCSMSGFVDTDSEIKTMEFGIGSAAGKDDVYSFKSIAHTNSFTATNFNSPLKAKRKYYATVKATNMLGLKCEESSDAISIDNTAPVAGVIVETTDLFHVDFEDSNNAGNDLRNKRTCKTADECKDIDATCQYSMDSIGVAWTHFIDDETGIATYHIGVGTSPGGGQIKPFFAVPVTENSYLITGLSLKGKAKLYVTIVAYNGAGLSTSVTSDGIYLNYVTQGMKPPKDIYVWDVESGVEDMDYQTGTEKLRAKWDFRGDPCPSSKYEWRIERMDGEVVQDFVTTFGQETASYDGLKMKDGEAYFVKVKNTNSLNDSYIIRSDSITIRRDKLVPGRVNDGPFEGLDLMYSASQIKVDTNWQDFGMRKKKVFTVVSGNAGVNEENNAAEKNQLVRYYEASLGTDRRFPHTKNNIVPYTKLNGSSLYTIFKYLKLQLHGLYYVTIRAHSASSAMAEVTSNGFKAGYDDGVTAGVIEMPDFWGSTSRLLTKWKDFKSEVGMFFYHVGVAETPLPNDLPCRKLILSKESEDNLMAKHFPVVHMRNVGDSTMIEPVNLNLAHNTNYWVYVVGTDNAGLCNITSEKFLVDATQPVKGDIKIGPYWKSRGASYTYSRDTIDVEWRGYSDPESGLDRYEISLWNEASCNSGGSAHLSVDWIKLTANYSSYSLIDLKLVESIPFFVKLRAYNKAGLFVETVSEPILLDNTKPTPGDVINGNDFVNDVVWQNSAREIHGNFLHYPTTSGTPCPDRLINIAAGGKSYDGVGLGVKQGVYWGIQYANSAVTKKGTDTIAIQMVKVEAGYSYLKSGAIWVDADNEGDFGATIQAADGDGLATTSVLFWDGPENELQAFNWEDEPSWTGKNSICQCCFKTPLPTNCPCDCAAYKQAKNTNNVTTKPQPTKGSTLPKSGIVALKTAPIKFTRQRACGFQLIAGKTPCAVLWCSSFNNTLEKLKEKRLLDFNPSSAAYTYKFSIYSNNDDPQKKQWCFAAYEVSRNILLGELCGIEEFSLKTKLVVHLWNKDNFIPKSRDWKATAFVSWFRLPPAKSLLCRYGKVFRGGTSAVISYEAGIGTSPLKTDVAAYKVISQPCVPCIKACDVYTCDKSCPSNKVTNIKFLLSGLSLPITANVNGTNETAIVVYYLTVKAILGSGMSAAGSSRGIQIDATPPIIDTDLNVTYIDTDQGQYKPVNYQSSNSTIRAAFRCVDEESMVVEYKWQIGRKPGLDDVQALTSVGKNPGGANTRLLGILHHNHTYYATVVCINAAGSELRYEDTKGLTMLFEKPIPKDIKNTLPGTKSFAKPVTPKNAKTATDGTYVAVTWTEPRDKNIKRIDVGFGTSVCTDGKAWDDDVFPLTWVAESEAGKFEIKSGAVYINGKKLNDLCKYIKPSRKSNYEQKANKGSCVFRMETGRTVFICMRFCDKADQCTLKEGGSVSFLEDGKSTVASSQNGKAISVTVTKSSRKRAVNSVAVIKTPDGLLPGQTLIVGLLDSSQFSANYGSDASLGFKQYIQDPNATKVMTERVLKGRIGTLLGSSFFVNSVGHVTMPGPMVVSVAYAAQDKNSTARPMLLHWDIGTLSWKITSKTCTSHNGPTESFDTAKLILNTLVCQTHSDTPKSVKRRKRATSGSFFNKETQFILAKVNAKTINDPPVITKEPMITVAEDSRIIYHTLTASDPDGDKFVFAMDGSKPKPTGTVTIATDGKLTYAACMDCVGLDTVYYKVTEINMGEITPLTTAASIVFRTTDIPDQPELFLSKNGTAIFSLAKTLNNVHEVNVTVEQFTGYNAAYRDLVLLVGAYDRDISNVLTIVPARSPLKGKLSLGAPARTEPTLPRTCDDRNAVALPCTGITFPHEEFKLSWVTLPLRYKPNTGFSGHDRFELQATDNTGYVSNKVTVNVYVLKNPCKNSATCRGLQEDFNCTALRRAFVEYNDFYSCSCSKGWAGAVCDVNPDDCLSTSCAFPLECYDKLGGYECRCPSDWPDCDKVDHLMPAIVAIVFILVISAALIGVAVWLHKKRKERYNKYKKHMDGSEKSDTGEPNPVPFLSGLASIPGALKHVGRIRRKTITGKVDSTTKGDEIELTKNSLSILPPLAGHGANSHGWLSYLDEIPAVGKPNALTSGSGANEVEESILMNEDAGSGSKRSSGAKVAWQKTRKGRASSVAFKNPAFVPEASPEAQAADVHGGSPGVAPANAPPTEKPESAPPAKQSAPGDLPEDDPPPYESPLPHQVPSDASEC
ncbi:uncharacterized protein LOC135499666 isoform X2 [Lineus longissimus]|uniref:uncharacterized protein LOC135499666 isoform X2 n=1 Tax=Lineus longissimus TaxID=88925 RepID=UPI00315CA387